MKTQNLAVMFTDIAGFTARTSRQTREENAVMLRRHDALLLPVVRAFRGRRVKAVGDALLVVFGSPTDSVLCGMAIQDRLWDYNRRVPPPERLEVRVAVNLGEVRVARSAFGTDVFGDPVNIAARVEGLAEAGEVWFTEAVYLSMNKAEVPAEDLGYRTLQGIPEAVRLYRAARGRYTLAAAPAHGQIVPQPPYGNVGLARVKGLAPPEPGALDRPPAVAAGLGRLTALWRAGELPAGAERLRAAFSPGAVRAVAVAALALTVAAGAAALWGRGREVRLIESGRLDEARTAIEARARTRGEGDPEVLFLRGRLREERARRGGSTPGREVFDLYARAAASGSGRALDALARLAGSDDCGVRRGAARALGATRSSDALGPLRRLAEAEPPAPEPADPVEGLRRLLGADGRCGDGDLARDAIRDIEESP